VCSVILVGLGLTGYTVRWSWGQQFRWR